MANLSCSGVRHCTRGSSGLATTRNRARALDTATLRRWRPYRNSIAARDVVGATRGHRVDDDRRLLALELVDGADARTFGQRGGELAHLRVVRRHDQDVVQRDLVLHAESVGPRLAEQPPHDLVHDLYFSARPAPVPSCTTGTNRSPAKPSTSWRSSPSPGATCSRPSYTTSEMNSQILGCIRYVDSRNQPRSAASSRARRARARAPTPRHPRDDCPSTAARAAADRRAARAASPRRSRRARRPVTSAPPRRRTARRRRRPSLAAPTATPCRRSRRTRRRAAASTARRCLSCSSTMPSRQRWWSSAFCSTRTDAARARPTASIRLPITAWLFAVMPTRLPACTSSTISSAPLVVFPEPGGPWMARNDVVERAGVGIAPSCAAAGRARRGTGRARARPCSITCSARRWIAALRSRWRRRRRDQRERMRAGERFGRASGRSSRRRRRARSTSPRASVARIVRLRTRP